MDGKLMARCGVAAAALVVALTGALAPTAVGGSGSPRTASAEVWHDIGIRCVGVEVDRCAYVQLNDTRTRIRAKGRIVDNPYGGDYTVAVNNTQLQTYVNDRWVTVSGSLGSDYDGWFGVADTAIGPAIYPVCTPRTYRSITAFHWRGPSPGDQWLTSKIIYSPCAP